MSRKGISLIEIIITIGIILIVMPVLAFVFYETSNTFAVQKSKNFLQIETRNNLDEINKWIKNAVNVMDSYTAPDNSVFDSGIDTLVLQIYSIDENNNIIPETYDYMVFYPDNLDPKLYKIKFYANEASSRNIADRILNHHLKSIVFRYFNSSGEEISENLADTKNITINIASEEVVHGKTNTIELGSQNKLRNK